MYPISIPGLTANFILQVLVVSYVLVCFISTILVFYKHTIPAWTHASEIQGTTANKYPNMLLLILFLLLLLESCVKFPLYIRVLQSEQLGHEFENTLISSLVSS